MAKKGGKRSGGGGGSKQRKYTRDNNGRFASTGTGATARGGRLKTAAGNKRKTQTAKMTGSKTASTVAKPKSLNAGTLKPKAATTAKLGGRLNPANKALRAADRKFFSTIQKEKGISKAANNARMDAKSSNNFTKTPTAKGAKINNTISQTKEKRNIASKQRLLKERLTRAYNLPGNGTDAKGRRTAKIKAKAIATLQGTKRPDISDSTVGGLRKARTSTGYKASSSKLPTPSRSARAKGRARTLAQTQRFDAVGRRLGNPTKMDKKARTGARAVDFNANPKAFLRRTLVQQVKSRGAKGTAGFVARPKSLTQTPKRIKPAAAPKAAKAAKSGMQATKRTPLAPDSSIAKRLAMFKSDKQLTDQRTKSLRAGLKKETNPLKKIETSSAISESQLKSKSYSNEITRMEARPIMGKRAGGRGDKPVSGPKAKHPNTIKGKPKRDAKVASKVKAKINLNAGRYKNIYINSANQKGKAAAKPKPRSIR